MEITYTIPDGSTGKEIAGYLRMQAGLLEGMTAKDAANRKNTDVAVESEDDEAEEVIISKSPKKGGLARIKAAASFEDEEDTTEESNNDDESFDDEPAKPAKKAKAKKITADEVADACKAHARANKKGREGTLAILKNKFGVKGISELTPDQFGAVIKALAV